MLKHATGRSELSVGYGGRRSTGVPTLSFRAQFRQWLNSSDIFRSYHWFTSLTTYFISHLSPFTTPHRLAFSRNQKHDHGP